MQSVSATQGMSRSFVLNHAQLNYAAVTSAQEHVPNVKQRRNTRPVSETVGRRAIVATNALHRAIWDRVLRARSAVLVIASTGNRHMYAAPYYDLV